MKGNGNIVKNILFELLWGFCLLQSNSDFIILFEMLISLFIYIKSPSLDLLSTELFCCLFSGCPRFTSFVWALIVTAFYWLSLLQSPELLFVFLLIKISFFTLCILLLLFSPLFFAFAILFL